MKRAVTKVLAALAALAAVGIGVAAVVYFVFTGPGEIPPAEHDFASLGAEEQAELIDRGRYLAQAADCAACHVSEDERTAYAGGLPMETPFGTVYGTNITPSREHGIGGWSADDLYRAMVYGVMPDGANLYPAMPYTSYHHTPRGDVDAIWAYLMNLEPIDKPDRPAEMIFPFSIRPAIAFWNLLFRPDDKTLPTVAEKGDDWRRGRYLVDVLGHCGECHTPRNLAFARTDAHLKGEVLEGAEAPDISPEGLAVRGWTAEGLTRFMGEGLAAQGTMTFRMYPVLKHSSRHLTGDDLQAMTTYLLDGAPEPVSLPLPPAGEPPAEGRDLYVGLCAGCHGSAGEGHPHASVPLDTNTTAMLENPRNLIRIIREGVPERPLAGWERMQAMPGFADRLSDQQVAALVTYLRRSWGGQEAAVTAGEVGDIAEDHEADGEVQPEDAGG